VPAADEIDYNGPMSHRPKISGDAGKLDWAHPLVRDWFFSRFGDATEPQEHGWNHILAGKACLIAAPTGSGKTLAAFLACIDRLVRKAVAGELENRTEVVYVSPLKALSNDIQKNLEGPLKEISELAQARGMQMPEIRAVVRTGDTLMAERRAMIKRPPHILVTTPESLFILLTAEQSREILKDVKTVIVDEIHAVADDKRGAHLTLSLERLDRLALKKPIRIGLSATQKPIETVAQFLVGNGRKPPVIVDVGHKRKLDLAVEVPEIPLGPVASNEMWIEIYDRINELVNENRSTLVFVNTRKMSERLAMHLGQRLGEEFVAAHHGSLSRKIRLNAERRLKSGQIKVLVATASLELGIDVGSVDLVCQIGSPRAISTGLQRIGRAGHWRGAIPKGRLFATTRDELVEISALVSAIKEGDLDRIEVPPCPLDILAQQIVAMSVSHDWQVDDLYSVVTRAYPYRHLERKAFDAVLEMLSEGIAARRGRYGSYLMKDAVNNRIKAKRGARLAALTSGGAIPDTAQYTVYAEPDGKVIGSLDEDFAVESNIGDIILLGNTSWRVRRVERTGRVLVEDAHGAAPTIPFWLGEGPSRTQELSRHVASLRKQISDMTLEVGPGPTSHAHPQFKAAAEWLMKQCGLSAAGAQQAVEYVLEGRALLGAVPTQDTVVAERFFDEGGGMQLVIHAPFGARINRAWGLALRKRFCRSFDFELQAAATDDGLNISLSDRHSFPLSDVFQFLHSHSVKEVLEQAALQSPLFNTRFRWDATRSLALLRMMGGKKVPPQLQRMRSEDLLSAVFPQATACQDNMEIGDITIPNHPLIEEVMKDVLTEAMDLEGLTELLKGIESGSIACVAVDTPLPSQFSHEILNSNPYSYLDDAPLEERRARAVQMRRVLPQSVLNEIGLLAPEAIAQVIEEALPDIQDADELHDLLMSLIFIPEQAPIWNHKAGQEIWMNFFADLVLQRRASRAISGEKTYWVTAERQEDLKLIFGDPLFQEKLPPLKGKENSPEEAIVSLLREWMQIAGPTTAPILSRMLGLALRDVEIALIELESEGSILRGNFAPSLAQPDVVQWCERRLLARIHRLTIGNLRKQIEPVTAAQYMRWLTHWQHVAPGSQVLGERGTLEVLRQLQGFEMPANAWEHEILKRRIKNYMPDFLDKLCLTGAVGWGRLSPHPATLIASPQHEQGQPLRRIVPTSVAPITFFIREDCDWMMPKHPAGDNIDSDVLTHAARSVREFLNTRGASFFADIARGTALLKTEVENALWELVAAGLVTSDGFDNLRALIDPKRRNGQGRQRFLRPRHGTGRWSLLHADAAKKGEAVESACWMLLGRYGVVFREVLTKESTIPRWRELLAGFRRLEDRGEIRGGRFVSGFLGEQFALPDAVDSLRAMRRREPAKEVVTVSGADPLNLVGIIVPGERITSVTAKSVTFVDGIAASPIESQAVGLD